MRYILLLFFGFCFVSVKSQTVTNGNFSSGTTGWGCSPETNPENVYGGATTNTVAEVDDLASLCQTIGGFVIGNTYRISLDYSRRMGSCPGPNPAGANIVLSNGTLTVSVSSNAANYTLQNSVFTFTATQTSLVLSITPNFTGTTCGFLVDNISIVPFNPLPIELIYFDAVAEQDKDLVQWQTASQINNDFFTIERSTDALNWQNIASVDGAGNSRQTIHYREEIAETLTGIYYYRLKQTDFNKRISYSSIVSIERAMNTECLVFPNPANASVTIQSSASLEKVELMTVTGQIVLNEDVSGTQYHINVTDVANGVYFVMAYDINKKVTRKKLVVQR